MKTKHLALVLYLFVFSPCTSSYTEPCYESKSSSFTKYLAWSDEKTQIAKYIADLLPNVPNNLSLLDIGAGNGLLTKQIAHLFHEIIAVEPSYALFNQLQQECAAPKYTCINKPFEKVFIEKQFDVILISFALQYIPNYQEELTQIQKMLKPNGLLLIIEVDTNNNELYSFYRKHITTVLGHTIEEPEYFYLDELLAKHFCVSKSSIQTSLIIPSVNQLLGIANFIFDTDWELFQEDALKIIKNDLASKYCDKDKITFTSPVTMWICTN